MMQHRSKWLVGGTVLIAAVLMMGLAGCSAIFERGAKEAVERSAGVKVDEKGNKISVTTDEGTAEVEGSKTELPEGFPKKFPVYEGAEIKNASKVSTPQGTSYSVQWVVGGDQGPVVAFYKKALPDNGYGVTSTVETEAHTGFVLKDGSVVGIRREGGKVQIDVMVVEKK